MTDLEMDNLLERLEGVILPRLTLAATVLHGQDHLREVARLAGQIVREMDGLPIEVESALAAGLLHDCGRVDDGGGNAHAHASADLAKNLLPSHLPHLPSERICQAIRRHADGEVTEDLLAGALWDADRLTLFRAGITPRLEFFSTPPGRRRAKQQLA